MPENIKKNINDGEKAVSEDRTPFREVLQKIELRDFIHQVESRPDKIIRVLRERRNNAEDFENVLRKDNKNEAIEDYRRGKELFDQLRTQYNIPVPDIDVVFGETEKGKIAAFVIVDRIEGKDWDDIMNHPFDEPVLETEMWRRVDEVFANLVRYYADAYAQGEEYLSDITRPWQWRWGHRVGEDNNNLWIVDVDPMFSRYDSDPARSYSEGNVGLFNSIAHIAYTVQDIQEQKNVVCKKTVAALRRFLKAVPYAHSHRHKIEDALR